MASMVRRMQRMVDHTGMEKQADGTYCRVSFPGRETRGVFGTKLGVQNPKEPMPHSCGPAERKRLKALRKKAA